MGINWEEEYINLWNVSEQLLENIDGLEIHSRAALRAFKNGVDYGRNLDAAQPDSAQDGLSRCNCKNGKSQSTAGCPVHGVTY